MSKVTIDVINGYFIEVDELNHTLKQRYRGKDKNGNPKDAERIIGYFSNVNACLKRIVRLVPLDENDGAVISLCEYAEMAEKAFDRVSEWRNDYAKPISEK